MDLREVSGNENRHPWELSRGRCMIKEIRKIGHVERVLDIGCGDGYFDRLLVQNDPRIKDLQGYDLFLENPSSEGVCRWTNDFSEVPDNSFDLILMMDVLEHVEDDRRFFRQICSKLKPHGQILITVPAFMKLYSLHDQELKHFRRYDRKMLRNVVESAECTILSESYFYVTLILLRLLTKNRTENLGMWKHGRKHFITRFTEAVLNTDYDVLRCLSKSRIIIGGLSLFMIVRKNSNG